MVMAAIGKYRHRVTLSAPGAPAGDPDGGFVEAHAPLVPAVWDCEITEATARDLEQVAGSALVATATHLLRGRYHPGLTVLCRVAFEGRTFEVASVQDRDTRRLEVSVLCREVLTRPAGGA
jgi:head-tail adaptor